MFKIYDTESEYTTANKRILCTLSDACANTGPARALCTKNTNGRLIERSEFASCIEQNSINIEANPLVYKKRQSIVEHPYGTIKRQWGFYYIITKREMKRASADVGFMFIAYNLRRIMNILGKDALKNLLIELCFLFFEKSTSVKAIIFEIRRFIFYKTLFQNIFLTL